MRLSYHFVLLLAIAVVYGCASRPPASPAAAIYDLLLPAIKLERSELIQQLKLHIKGGRVVSINHLLDDWDTSVRWDTPDELEVTMHARHFSSGITNPQLFGKFVTIEEHRAGTLQVSVTFNTSSTDLTGRPDRTLTLVNHQVPRVPAARDPWLQQLNARGSVPARPTSAR